YRPGPVLHSFLDSSRTFAPVLTGGVLTGTTISGSNRGGPNRHPTGNYPSRRDDMTVFCRSGRTSPRGVGRPRRPAQCRAAMPGGFRSLLSVRIAGARHPVVPAAVTLAALGRVPARRG